MMAVILTLIIHALLEDNKKLLASKLCLRESPYMIQFHVYFDDIQK